MSRKRIVIIVLAVAVMSAGVVLATRPAVRQQAAAWLGRDDPTTDGIIASGFIEAEEVSIAAEVSGRIVELPVADGDEVEAGQVLVRLDDRLAQAQADVARAALEVAQATLAQVRAGARPERIRQAQAALEQAEAARDGAYQAWQDLLAMVENPQELDAQIALAEAQLAASQAGVSQATALRSTAGIANDAFQHILADHPAGSQERVQVASGPIEDLLPGLPPELVALIGDLADGTYTYENWEVVLENGYATVYKWVTFHYTIEAYLLPNDYARASAGVSAAEATRQGAQEALNLLYAMRRDPQALQAQVNAAETQFRAAEATVALARAQLDGLRAGATEAEIAAVEAQVQQAQAQLDGALALLDKTVIVSPASGQVLEVIGHVGELASAGAPLVVLADLDTVNLTIYVPENRLGQVQVGQSVEVRVDSFPERVFLGRVAAIASQAEFIPRNVQTQEERVNMVFAVEVVISNPDHALKPGMPADALLVTE